MEETKIEIARTQSSTQEQDQKQRTDNNQARDATRQLNTATLSDDGNGR